MRKKPVLARAADSQAVNPYALLTDAPEDRFRAEYLAVGDDQDVAGLHPTRICLLLGKKLDRALEACCHFRAAVGGHGLEKLACRLPVPGNGFCEPVTEQVSAITERHKSELIDLIESAETSFDGLLGLIDGRTLH